jgi:hypothetical protein
MQAKCISPVEVASRVHDAIQQASYYDEHFFVREAGLSVAVLHTLRGLGMALCFNVVSRIIDLQGGFGQPRGSV